MNTILLHKFNESQRQEINWGLLMQVDVSLFAHVKLPSHRMKKIRLRLWRQKVDYYAVGLSIEQRREVEYGLLQGADVFAYANANIPVLEMEKIRNTLLAERNGGKCMTVLLN